MHSYRLAEYLEESLHFKHLTKEQRDALETFLELLTKEAWELILSP